MRDDDKTDLTGWLGLRKLPDLTKARWLGQLLSFGGAVIVGGLFLLALATAFKLLFSATFGALLDDPRSALGVGGVTVALIGAPFVIWRSVVAQKTVNVTEQGHITDRINTAVEGLGAEKVVDRVGRPITIWTGKPQILTRQVEDPGKFSLPPRAVEMRRYSGASLQGDPDLNKVFDGLHVDVKSWPKEKTMIEWQGSDTEVGKTEHIAKVGDWQVFSETRPNLEVRIGAIYALERIAQDSDRDHVQIMEILCAYIRQNAPAPETDDWPELEMRDSEDVGPLEADWDDRLKTFRQKQNEAKANLKKPREDIQTALTVIGRRGPKQQRLEAGRGIEAVFPFDTPCPDYDGPEDAHDRAALDAYQGKLNAWKKRLRAYAGYRLDLRGADLRGADLSGADLKGARLTGTYLQGADLRAARLQGSGLLGAYLHGAGFQGAQLQGADLKKARLQRADLLEARLQGAVLVEARLQGTVLLQARLQGAVLWEARLQGAVLWEARLQGADLEGARLQGAVLGEARLQGADLGAAPLQGAVLWEARLDKDTDLSAAILRGVTLRSVDCTDVPQITEHLTDMFGDASVTLPGGHGPGHDDWPEHWPEFDLGSDFDVEWRKWQADPEGYRPPDPPEPESAA